MVKLRKLYESSERVHKLLDMAMKIEGMPRRITTHAAKIVISDDAISNHIPLVRTYEGDLATQYDASTIDELRFHIIDL